MYITLSTHLNALMDRTDQLLHGSEEAWKGKVTFSSLSRSARAKKPEMGHILLCGCGTSTARFYFTPSENSTRETRRGAWQELLSLQHIPWLLQYLVEMRAEKGEVKTWRDLWELWSWSRSGSCKEYPHPCLKPSSNQCSVTVFKVKKMWIT